MASVKTSTPVKAGPVVLNIGNEMVAALKSGDLNTYVQRRTQYLALRQVDAMIRKLHDETFDTLKQAESLGKTIPQLKDKRVTRFHVVSDKKRGRPAKDKVNPADLF